MPQQKIAASILSANFGYLADEVNAALAAGADTVHFDVMDHHFVPNLSFGAVICDSLRKSGISALIDVHLMVDDPEAYIEPFAKAGASIITFHPETVTDVAAVVAEIKKHSMGAGLVFNPDKPVDIELSIAKELDMILLMSVFPGFGGQAFIEEVLTKAKQTRAWLDQNKLTATLAIDGGIKADNIGRVAKTGVDYFVVGSGLFGASDYGERIGELRQALLV